jgi:hypothetical protein
MRPIVSLFPNLVPPLAVVPPFALFMAISHHIDNGTWLPFDSVWMFTRALAFAYVIAFTFHAVYGTLVFFAARRLGIRHVVSWTSLYVIPLALVALISLDSDADFVGSAVYVGFAFAISLAAWPYAREPLARCR